MERKIFDYALELITQFNQKNINELMSPKDVGIEIDNYPGIITLLSIIGLIKTTQGTQKIYILSYDQDSAKQKLSKMISLIEELSKALDKERQLPRKNVLPILEKHGFQEETYQDCVSLLASLNISTSAGKGRSGGIARYNNDEINKNIENATAEIENEKNEEKKEKKSNEHEKVLYPNAEKFLLEQGYDALILGVNKKLKGKWNTPDIIGYSIEKLNVIGGAYLETVSIEVKWKISKEAIAEANSHQKLVNKTFLWINQEIDDIDEEYLTDIMEKGIGLICLKNKIPVLHCAAKQNYLTPYQIDFFLDTALTGEYESTKIEIKNDIAQQFYSDYFKSRL